MAEEKIGTLQYDMLVNEQKLDKQLEDITKKLQEKDKQWKEILSGQGAVSSPKINVADLSNLTKANEAIALSTTNIKTSIAKLKKELADSVKAYEKLTQAKRDDDQVGGQLLTKINTQKDQLNEYNKTLRQNVEARKQSLAQAKEEQAAKTSLESQRSKAFVKTNLDEEKKITNEIKQQEAALRSLEAQRSKAFVRGEVEKEKQITNEIKQQQAALRSLEAQRSRAFVASKNKELREEAIQTRRLWQEQKLKIAVDQQAAGSIERLRAQYALLKFQLAQVKVTDPNAVANINQLQASIRGVKSEIQALQPTLGIWGKLVSAIRTYATAYVSVQAVMGLGKAIFNQTKELDALDFSMRTIIKSSVELAGTQKFLSDIAINYGGDLLTLSERYIKFRAAAVQSNVSAAETQKIFESVSKAAGTLGLKTDELSGVYLALEQMLSKGKVTTEELRRQLGERLPGAFGIMANALGVTIPELDKLLKKGEVLSTVALPKFAAALEKAYGIESLKKIDTLAAAQGRMSTEFTGLIKAMEASGGFKDAINGIASFIGFIKDNISTIALFSKVVLAISAAILINRIATAAFVLVQKASVILTGSQISKMTQLTAAQLASAEATWVNVRAWGALSTTFKTFGGWVSIIINAIVGVAAYMLLFRKETEASTEEIKSWQAEVRGVTQTVDYLIKALKSSKEGSEQHKNAMLELNTIAVKYNSTLFTENDLLDKNNKTRGELIGKLDEEIRKKRFLVDMDAANKNLADVINPIQDKFFEFYKGVEGGAVIASDEFNRFVDAIQSGENINPKDFKGLNANSFDEFSTLIGKASKAYRDFNKARADADSYYQEKKKPELFKTDDIEKAKKEFEEFAKLQKQGVENLFVGQFAGQDTNTFEQWINKQIKLLSSSKESAEANKDAIIALYVALADFDKKQQPGGNKQQKLLEDRNEALKRLNDKYLADQEEFANYEMGITTGRIAAMEDGIEKEKALNELAYENRIKAIEKEKIATIKLLNEANGTKIGGNGEIVSFDSKGRDSTVQAAIDAARESDLQKRINAKNDEADGIIRIEKDTQLKLKEIRRDAEDQFKTGLEKDRAAINEKYDDWVRKAKEAGNLVLAIELDLLRENALDEMYRQNALDRLDFEREIQYKKNEIAQGGSENQRKLDKKNFDTYVKYEKEKIKLLKASKSTEQQGIDAQENLDLDAKLFKLKQEAEIRSQIIDGAKQLTGIIFEQVRGTELQKAAMEDVANAMTQIFGNLVTQNYIGAAVSLMGLIANSGKAEAAREEERIDLMNELLDVQLKYNLALNDQIGLESEQSIFFQDDAKEINIASQKLKGATDAYNKVLSDWLKKLNYAMSPVNFESDLTNTLSTILVDTNEGSKRLLYLYPELIDKNGRLNISLAETVVTLSGLATAEKQVLTGLIEWGKKIEEAEKAMSDAVASIIGDLGSSIYRAISDAWDNGTDSFMAFKGAVSDGLEDIIKQMAFNAIWAASLETFKEGIINSYKAGGDQTIFDDIDKFFAAAPDNIKLTNEALAELNKRAAESGMDWSGVSSSQAGISKGIQAVTEDTARRLEGLINSVRETGVIQVGKVQQLVESSAMIQGYAAQSLGHLRNIDTTTAAQLTLFNEVMTTANGVAGKGMRVYMQ